MAGDEGWPAGPAHPDPAYVRSWYREGLAHGREGVAPLPLAMLGEPPTVAAYLAAYEDGYAAGVAERRGAC